MAAKHQVLMRPFGLFVGRASVWSAGHSPAFEGPCATREREDAPHSKRDRETSILSNFTFLVQ